ncbi:hypothetical protein CIG79_00550 [Escherichia coli]|uniref:Uncharacterized protein n=2 Tax=Enterobacteriaceae TaxID=543 RepID=A0A5E9YF69_ECOLX|nr:hypothetical protein AM434_28755 [Escherichia coli]OOO83746.1 hypothetical protein AJR32_007450 [Shigella sonnei]ATB11890.1 hypothetical protein CJU64_27965 [Escherichia coli]OKT03046.1 hypothetical protein ACN55_25810 [Escherichia coli]OKT14982.1 hypothetical protein ACN61_13010 [Escherichia coli]
MLKKHPFRGAFLVFWGFKFLSMNGEEIWPWMLPTDPRRHLLSEQSEISVISATGCHSGLSKALLPLTYVSSAI